MGDAPFDPLVVAVFDFGKKRAIDAYWGDDERKEQADAYLARLSSVLAAARAVASSPNDAHTLAMADRLRDALAAADGAR